MISGFSIDIHIRIHFHFSTFFWVLASGPTTVTSAGPLLLFPTLAEASNYATGLQLDFPE